MAEDRPICKTPVIASEGEAIHVQLSRMNCRVGKGLLAMTVPTKAKTPEQAPGFSSTKLLGLIRNHV
jgi:hypothetical protein